MSVESFIEGYIDALLWSESACARWSDSLGRYVPDESETGEYESGDSSFESLNFDRSDLSVSALRDIEIDCKEFYEENSALWNNEKDEDRDDYAGHNFLLTRNGHGSGFWDGDYPISGDALSERSRVYGETSAMLNGDGEIYVT